MTSHTLASRSVVAVTVLLMLSTTGSGAAFRSTDDRPSETDVLFVYDASLSNIAEVELARLATRMANSSSVRSFAEHMVADHSTTQQELAAVAVAHGIDLPPHLLDVPAETAQPPARDDPWFDSTYMKGQVLAHQRALELFSAEATKGSDQALREYARSQIPALLAHLEEAYLVISHTRRADGVE